MRSGWNFGSFDSQYTPFKQKTALDYLYPFLSSSVHNFCARTDWRTDGRTDIFHTFSEIYCPCSGCWTRQKHYPYCSKVFNKLRKQQSLKRVKRPNAHKHKKSRKTLEQIIIFKFSIEKSTFRRDNYTKGPFKLPFKGPE